MASVSGLDAKKRTVVRDRTVQAAMLAYNRRAAVHYTQGDRRWDGISNERIARQGEYPYYADCSGFATWCLWNGLYVPYKARDTVNGLRWQYGFTGTMLENGKQVRDMANVLRGDLVIYGTGYPGKHVAVIVGRKDGKLMVVSHGSEGGPYYVAYNYRSDVLQIRRFI